MLHQVIETLNAPRGTALALRQFHRRQMGRPRRRRIFRALEGFTMFALNQGEVCTCPSHALVQKSIYDKFMEKAVARVEKIKQGNPLEISIMVGAQASNDQLEKILSYVDIGKKEGAS
jgi:acyl-CoA reductase-like NAD-dependent aldehyde dehydrogenase